MPNDFGYFSLLSYGTEIANNIGSISSCLVAQHLPFLLLFSGLQIGVKLSCVKGQALAFYHKESLPRISAYSSQGDSADTDSGQVA